MTSPIGGSRPSPPPVAFGSKQDIKKEPTSATANLALAPPDSYNGRGSSARVPEAPLTSAQSKLREVFEGIPGERLAYTLPAIENLAAFRVPLLGTPISKKDGCVTPDELKRGRATLRAHLSDLSPKGLEALKKLDDTWKMALDDKEQKDPDKVRNHFMRIDEVARRMEENAPALAKLDGDKDYISLRDMYHLQKLLGIL